jgi:hypothetical protein
VSALFSLHNFSEARLPGAQEASAFRAAQKRDFQAEAALPLFWIAMYHSNDVHAASDASGNAFLVTKAERASERLWRRRRGVLVNVGLRYADLFDEFRRIVRDEMGPFVLVRAAQLPAQRRSTYQRELTDALDAFTMLDMATEFPKNAALRNLVGFDALTKSIDAPSAPYLMAGRDRRKQWPKEGAIYRESGVEHAPSADRAALTRWEKWKRRV